MSLKIPPVMYLRQLNRWALKQYRLYEDRIHRLLKPNANHQNIDTYRPFIPDKVDNKLLVKEAANYFSLPKHDIQSRRSDYLKLHNEKEYVTSLGERKTLTFEEAFVIYIGLLQVNPVSIVEIGTQYGKSTRRILDIIQYIGVDCNVTCFDIVDDLKYVSHEEVYLVLKDVTNNVRECVFEHLNPQLIFLDARPYKLLFNVISEFLDWSLRFPSILAIHDCSNGLFNPSMRIERDNPLTAITSLTGIWERHVLSEIFGIPNELLDDLTTETHRLKIFHTQHGLSLLTPLSLLK